MTETKIKHKASRAKIDYTTRYEAEHYDNVLLRLPRGTKDRIQATGDTVNGFVVRAVLAALAEIEERRR